METKDMTYAKIDYLNGIALLVLAIILGASLTELSTKQLTVATLGIVGVVLCFFKPKLPLFIFFLFIPLELITILPSQTLTKFIGLYLFGLFFMELAVTKRIHLPMGRKKLYILMFGIVSGLSLLVASDKSIGLIYVISLCLLIGMYFILSFTIKDIRTLHIAVLSLLVGGFISIVMGFLGQGWMREGFADRGSFTRIGGLWGDPNEFASMMLVFIPLSLVQFFHFKNFFMRTIAIGFFTIFLFGFINTFSRGGFLGFSVLLILGVFKLHRFEKSSNKLKILALAMILTVITGGVFLTRSETITDRLETLKTPFESRSETESAISSRFEAYRQAFSSFLDRPILGLGFRNFHTISSKKVVHNTYLEVLACTGLLGFIPFMAILYTSWKELIRVQNVWKPGAGKRSIIYDYALAFELGFLSFLASAIFLTLDLFKITWLIITISSILYGISTNLDLIKQKSKNLVQ